MQNKIRILPEDGAIKQVALMRAQQAIASTTEGSFGVGFAEGIVEQNGFCCASVWCAIVNLQDQAHFGTQTIYELSQELYARISDNSLTESQIELFVEHNHPMLYEDLVRQALSEFKK